MGACCGREKKFEGVVGGEVDDVEDAGDVRVEDGGSRVRLGGNSMYTSMFSQGGRKGINQDAMTVWEVTVIPVCYHSNNKFQTDFPFFLLFLFRYS